MSFGNSLLSLSEGGRVQVLCTHTHKKTTQRSLMKKKQKTEKNKKQQMCLGTVYALLIRAEIAEISLQA